jgi:hypothetical protein
MKEFSAKNYTVLITWLKHNICQIQQQISMRKGTLKANQPEDIETFFDQSRQKTRKIDSKTLRSLDPSNPM